MNAIRVCILVLAVITTATPAKPPQQKPAAQPTQAQLQQQIDDLKKKLEETWQTANTAKLGNDFAKQAQAEAKDYYDKVLATETRSLWIMGIFITVLLALAARIGFNTFERLTQSAIREATIQLRTEYNQTLANEVQKLKVSNEKEMNSLSDDLQAKIAEESNVLRRVSEWNLQVSQAFAFGVQMRYSLATNCFREATRIYKQVKEAETMTLNSAATTIANTLESAALESPAQRTDKIQEELSNPIYDGMEIELALTAVNRPEFAQAIRDRKKATPTQPRPASTTQAAAPAAAAKPDLEPE